MSAIDFTRCAVANDCLGERPCEVEDLQIGGDCAAECQSDSTPNSPFPCVSSSNATGGWSEVDGFAGFFPCGGDTFPGTGGAGQGTRLSPTEFEIDFFGGDDSGEGTTTVEVALFRFDGDPMQLGGLTVDHVADLVDLGVISAQDVLFVTEIMSFDHVLEIVDVTGIPDSELVLFAAGNGPFPTQSGCEPPDVPASDWIGAVVLIGMFLLLGCVPSLGAYSHARRPGCAK